MGLNTARKTYSDGKKLGGLVEGTYVHVDDVLVELRKLAAGYRQGTLPPVLASTALKKFADDLEKVKV